MRDDFLSDRKRQLVHCVRAVRVVCTMCHLNANKSANAILRKKLKETNRERHCMGIVLDEQLQSIAFVLKNMMHDVEAERITIKEEIMNACIVQCNCK